MEHLMTRATYLHGNIARWIMNSTRIVLYGVSVKSGVYKNVGETASKGHARPTRVAMHL